MGTGDEMASFWDERAKENAYFFVDSRLDFENPDTDRFWAQGEEDLATLLNMAGAAVGPGDDVVEIGCGLGRLTRGLAARAATVRALDVSAEMLQQARELNPSLEGVTWLHGDGTSLAGIDSSSADACVSHVVFQHVPEAAITLGYVREMGRILRPGGWSAFQVSTDPAVHSPSPLRRARMWWRAGRGNHKGASGLGNPNWLGSAVSMPDLRQAASDAGLEVAHVVGEGTQYCVVRLERPA
ncbi:MAG TPA: class I SAM-dependent methyltransferase [Thermoleophilaceae bacterium]|nr:class I SAM-dependent methyltransferase [Thermoleophilaceae bacterium]